MKVMLVWELGAQLGHIGTLLPIADALADQGHEVVFALKDLSYARSLIGTRYPFFRAPRRTDKTQPGRHFESFADILLHAGFDNTDVLKGLTSAWRALYAQLRPDWVIYNHAPVALFSARGLHFKKTCVGIGFEIPPGDIAFPRFRHWEPDTASSIAHRKHSHQQVVNNGNRAAQRLGMPILDQLPEIFCAADHKLTTFPQLDHYPARSTANYIGPIGGLGRHASVEKQDGERWLFCYLWARHRGNLELLKALADRSDFKTLAVVPDLPSPSPDHQRHKNLILTRLPIDLSALSSWAELVVCQGNHGTAACALGQGIPLVNRPVTLEQAMLAQRVEAAGAGTTLQEGVGPTEAAQHIADAFRQKAGRPGASIIKAMAGSAELKTGAALVAELT